MTTTQNSVLLSGPSRRQEYETQFSARESALIRVYERLRAEWEKQLDLLDSTDPVTGRHFLEEAEMLDRQLSAMEWKLPDTYTFRDDAAPPSGATSIASAFARLLHNHRHTTSRAAANV